MVHVNLTKALQITGTGDKAKCFFLRQAGNAASRIMARIADFATGITASEVMEKEFSSKENHPHIDDKYDIDKVTENVRIEALKALYVLSDHNADRMRLAVNAFIAKLDTYKDGEP